MAKELQSCKEVRGKDFINLLFKVENERPAPGKEKHKCQKIPCLVLDAFGHG